MRSTANIIASCFLFAAGCSPQIKVVPGQIVTNETTVCYSELKDSAILIALGDKRLTKGEMEWRRNEFKTLALKYDESGGKDFNKRWEENLDPISWRIASDFLLRNSFASEARARGVAASEADNKAAEGAVAVKLKALGVTRDDYAKSYYGGEGALRRKIADDALAKAVFPVLFGDRLNVTKEEVEKIQADLEKFNKDAAKTNALLLARMEKLRDELQKGRYDLVAQESADEEVKVAHPLPSGFKFEELAGITTEGLPDAELVPEAVKATETGMWTKPVELEDTIDVYLITNYVRKSGRMPSTYSGYRVYAEKNLGYVVPDKSKLYSDLRNRRNMEIVLPMGEKLMQKLGVVYPYGLVWESAYKDRRKEKTPAKANGKKPLTNEKEETRK